MKALVTWRVAAASLGLAVGAAASNQAAGWIPDRLGSAVVNGQSEPEWQSAGSVIDPDGEARIHQLPSRVIWLIDDHLAKKAQGPEVPDCIWMGLPTVDPVPGRPSGPWEFAELVKAAREILLGHVVASAPGFFEGAPTQLLAVQVDDRIKSERQPVGGSPEVVFIAYPRTRFVVGKYEFCRENDLPAPPAVGAETLFLSLDSGTEAVPSLFALVMNGAELFWASDTGRGLAATRLIEQTTPSVKAGTSLEALISEAKAATSGGKP